MKLNTLKQMLKKNKAIDAVSRIIAYPTLKLQYTRANKAALMRRQGNNESEFLWIKDLKNKYDGERCFIVATGPSLTIEDLELIKGEYCFGMNSCVLALDKTSWRPQFYAIQDEYVYGKLEEKLVLNKELQDIWVSESIRSKFSIPTRFKVFPLHYLDHKMFHSHGFGQFKFSDDCYSCIYDGYTITFSIMQMACYMGFKNIYLLGSDCNYNQKKSHFVEYGHSDPKATIMGDKMIQGHYEFNKFANSIGVRVVNCTRGGMLEVYPRESLESVLNRK